MSCIATPKIGYFDVNNNTVEMSIVGMLKNLKEEMKTSIKSLKGIYWLLIFLSNTKLEYFVDGIILLNNKVDGKVNEIKEEIDGRIESIKTELDRVNRQFHLELDNIKLDITR